MRIRKRVWTTKRGERKTGYIVDLGLHPISRRRRRKQFPTRAAARAWLEQRPPERTGPPTTVKAAGEAWIHHVKGKGRSHATWCKYHQHLNKHIAPIPVPQHEGDNDPVPFGRWELADLKASTVLRFSMALREAGRSGIMVQKVMASLRMLLRYAANADLGPGTTGDTIRATVAKREKRPVLVPTPEQVRTLLRLLNSQKGPVTLGQALINLLPSTGLRPEEVRALPETHVHVTERPYYVDVAYAADERNVIGPPKSAAGYRRIPLTDDVARILRAWLKQKPKNNHPVVGPLVFPTSGGHVYGPANLYHRVWKPLMKAAGLIEVHDAIDPKTKERRWRPLFTMYALRHFYAWVLIKQRGVREKELQKKMGHSSIQITLDTYGGWWDDEASDARIAAGVGKFLAG